MCPNQWREDRREIWGWALYDFAHSAYHTSVTSVIFNVYFVEAVVGPQGAGLLGMRLPGDSIFGFAVSLSMLLVFLTAPVLGAIADFSACKKRFLFCFSYSGVLTTALLYFVGPGKVWLGVLFFVLSNLALEAGLSFYHAFLSEITTRERIGRVSGFGWALGYVGSVLCLLLNLAMIERPNWFHLPDSDYVPVRAAMVVVAVWWGLFAIPTFLWVRERAIPQILPAGSHYLKVGFQRLLSTLQNIQDYRELVKFLIAFLIYNDGIQTVIVMAAIFGATVLKMPREELILALLLNQTVAFFGALAFGYLADRMPTKTAIGISLGVWCGALLWALVIDQSWQFWALSVVVGLVLGGSQSASRALFAQFTPPEKSAEFFAFFSVSGKFASVAGPFLFGVVSAVAGTRYAIGSLLAFFVAGGLLLCRVNEAVGRQQGQAGATG